MQIEKSIRSLLINDAAVSGYISGRVYPIYAPQNATYPCITYSRISTNKEHTVTGSIGFAETTFQLNIIAEDYTTSRELADAVRLLLDGYKGSDAYTDKIGGIFIDNDTDIYYDDLDLHCSMIDILVPHSETL